MGVNKIIFRFVGTFNRVKTDACGTIKTARHAYCFNEYHDGSKRDNRKRRKLKW